MLSKLHIAVKGAVAVGKTMLLPKLHSIIASHNIDIDLVQYLNLLINGSNGRAKMKIGIYLK